MSVNPLDRTDQRLIILVNQLGDPVVETQSIAEEVDLGFQSTLDRLESLEDQGWIAGQRGDGQKVWQVSSKASLLIRTDSEPPEDDGDDEDIIDAEESESESGAEEDGESAESADGQ